MNKKIIEKEVDYWLLILVYDGGGKEKTGHGSPREEEDEHAQLRGEEAELQAGYAHLLLLCGFLFCNLPSNYVSHIYNSVTIKKNQLSESWAY